MNREWTQALAIILVCSNVRYFRILCKSLSLFFAEVHKLVMWFWMLDSSRLSNQVLISQLFEYMSIFYIEFNKSCETYFKLHLHIFICFHIYYYDVIVENYHCNSWEMFWQWGCRPHTAGIVSNRIPRHRLWYNVEELFKASSVIWDTRDSSSGCGLQSPLQWLLDHGSNVLY